MNIWKKAALGALALAGAATATATTAEARPYYASAYCDPYSRWYDPYRCDEDDYYTGRVFIDGLWLTDRFRYRTYGGYREFYYRGGWHRGTGYHGGGFGRGHGGWGGGRGHGGWGGGHGGGHHGHH